MDKEVFSGIIQEIRKKTTTILLRYELLPIEPILDLEYEIFKILSYYVD